jgi:hypothetical protein
LPSVTILPAGAVDNGESGIPGWLIPVIIVAAVIIVLIVILIFRRKKKVY